MKKVYSKLLTMDYSQTVAEIVFAYNNSLAKNFRTYPYVNYAEKVTEERFPIPLELVGKKITLEAEIVFSETTILEEFLSEIHYSGCRGGSVLELLSFGALFPEILDEFEIMALGSLIDNNTVYYVRHRFHNIFRYHISAMYFGWFPVSVACLIIREK
jgi:hypothetical protein